MEAAKNVMHRSACQELFRRDILSIPAPNRHEFNPFNRTSFEKRKPKDRGTPLFGSCQTTEGCSAHDPRLLRACRTVQPFKSCSGATALNRQKFNPLHHSSFGSAERSQKARELARNALFWMKNKVGQRQIQLIMKAAKLMLYRPA